VVGQLAPPFALAGQVDVLARPPPGREVGAQHAHAEAAEDLKPVASFGCAAHQRQCFGQRIVRGASGRPVWCGHARFAPQCARADIACRRRNSIMVT
jgi:hypothetical protein